MFLLAAAASSAAGTAEVVLSSDFRIDEAGAVSIATAISGMRHEARRYPEYGAIEWQVRLKNPTGTTAPLYQDLKSADFVVRFPTPGPVTLHWNKGSHAESSDFERRVEALTNGRSFALESFGGRSSDGAMPYFNLAGNGGGLIVAVGWTGDWRTSFEAPSEGHVRVLAGLKRSRFRLSTGEEVRLPSILVMSYRGDWLDGQNQFRRLMLRHFTPANQPPLKLMPVAASVHGMIGFNDTTEANLVALARDMAALKLPLDTFWLDAGWNDGGFPPGQGNPEPDPKRFPRGRHRHLPAGLQSVSRVLLAYQRGAGRSWAAGGALHQRAL